MIRDAGGVRAGASAAGACSYIPHTVLKVTCLGLGAGAAKFVLDWSNDIYQEDIMASLIFMDDVDFELYMIPFYLVIAHIASKSSSKNKQAEKSE